METGAMMALEAKLGSVTFEVELDSVVLEKLEALEAKLGSMLHIWIGDAGSKSSTMNARAVAPERSTYEDNLERWALHDCSAVVNPRDDEEMRRLFQRWRATHSKAVTATGAVTPRSLDRSWTAFVERWRRVRKLTRGCVWGLWRAKSAVCRGRLIVIAVTFTLWRSVDRVAGMAGDPVPPSGSDTSKIRRTPNPSAL
ncbi:uncharacterized protein IUM83_02946 [Phytophthora cinnamomi]|uniref:uncharacterized protein n=1 Tax=Phytophthora cinnamomi TaxID=4785 RepID=UPI00355A04E7|nr:hypothetical protein IUM83_02946 [Phytophthora cinnamomi]